MNKLSLLLAFFTFVLTAIIIKLFFIQVLSAGDVTRSYVQTSQILPQRGEIFDRHQEPLVLNQTTYGVYAEPQKIANKANAAEKLEEILQIGTATIEAKISTDKLWTPITTGLDKKKKETIAALKMTGIGFYEESRRFYPEASAAAHLLGFVGKNEKGENVGYFGVEGYYEKDLIGLPGILKTERDLFGRPIFIGVQDKIQEEDGRDLILTIDKSIQALAKEKLLSGMQRYDAKEGCIIIADPQRLAIRALVCLPDFDPVRYGRFSEEYFRNPAISTLYEPGSIFKPLVMAAGLQEKVIRPNDLYDEKGPIKIGKYEIRTWNNQYEGSITMTRLLEKSSNVGLVYIAKKLGRQRLLSYLKQYGIGERTGIDLEGETFTRLKPEAEWHEIDEATASFGQGIAVTQMQMLRAFAALINGGYMLKPHVVEAVKSSDNSLDKMLLSKGRRVLNETASAQIRKMLEAAVEHGDARWARPKGYRIGGKTGTAQLPIAGHYDPNKTVASFIGFAPVEKPQFIVLVTLKEPTASPWGSETAAPLFFDLVKDLFVYYNIAPE